MEASVRASATNCLEPRYFTMDDLSAEDSWGPPLAGTEADTTAKTIAIIATRPSVANTAVSAPHDSAVPGQDCFFVCRLIEGFACMYFLISRTTVSLLSKTAVTL
jgi:hypothetical protein